MPFKTVLNIIGVNQSADDVRSAVELCRQAEAHLSVLVVSLISPPPFAGYGEIVLNSWLEERRSDIARLQEQAAAIGGLLERQGISFRVETLYVEVGWADTQIGERARYADLVVMGSHARSDAALGRYALEGALFQSPAPVFLMPAGHASTLQPRSVMIAWDSRDEAGRAIRSALELLVQADTVNIAIVDPQASTNANGEEPGADIATYLARQGVRAAVQVLAGGGRTVGEVLCRHARDIGAEMIVMGAYRHSRMRERIFGGVTRSMLENADRPLFLAH
ncbi:universal stress protein [Rhizobium binae]|uniref:universal stress protein n=1 Tax=Rhizobium binae TaxID=1138190 RepID=UPI003DA941E8